MFSTVHSFSVDPEDLATYAERLRIEEPFGPLAEAAARLVTISNPPATAAALHRLADRLRVDLAMLSQATGSLGRATRHAASDYEAVEASIGWAISPPGVPASSHGPHG